jgi:nitroreductase
MLKLSILILFVMIALSTQAQVSNNISLNPPDLGRDGTLMQALLQRASAREFDTTMISLNDLSDLLWAGNGINRPGDGKRTAASALNAQEIDLYVIMKNAVYLYVAENHSLAFVTDGDYRKLVAGRQERMSVAPLFILLAGDISRFRTGEEKQRLEWCDIDAGIVSQNIMLFCSAANLSCRPRVTMEKEELHSILKLKESQHLILNLPVCKMKH